MMDTLDAWAVVRLKRVYLPALKAALERRRKKDNIVMNDMVRHSVSVRDECEYAVGRHSLTIKDRDLYYGRPFRTVLVVAPPPVCSASAAAV